MMEVHDGYITHYSTQKFSLQMDIQILKVVAMLVLGTKSRVAIL